MKTSLSLAFIALISNGVLAQQDTNPPVTPPATLAPPVAAPAPPAEQKAEAPAPKKKARKQSPAPTARKPAEPAVPLAPGPATIFGGNVNVRGQAKLTSERVALLKTGDTVTVLEEIILDKPAADEPARWARIALPADVKAWVNTLFIDTTNKTVIPRRLNLRSGAGENFSVVGLLERGHQIQEVGAVKGNWMQIEAPTNAFAFVASRYLKQEAPAAVPPVTPPPAQVESPPVTTPVAEPPPVIPAPLPEAAAPPPAVEPAFVVATTPADAAAIERAREATRNKIAELVAQEIPPPRIVAHEGIVRSTVSVQAPTRFALVDPATGKTVNYLHTTSTNLDLRKWKGRRVVITGEEALDERWKNTPLLTIQKIQVVE